MKKNSVRILSASAASLLLVSVLCIGSYAALKESGVIASDEYIGVEKAKEIVLAHAGIASDNAWFEDAELEREKGVAVYEIEFYSDSVEYDYKVDAKSGEVLKARSELDGDLLQNAPSQEAGGYIGVDAAKQIALSHAGLDGAGVRFEEVELDRERQKAVYEMEFYFDGVEYEYKVDALSGEVLKSKVEGRPSSSAPAVASEPEAPAPEAPAPEAPAPEAPAPEAPAPEAPAPEAPAPEAPAPEAPAPEAPAPEAPAPEAPAYIGVEAAKEIALAHAGVALADARFEEAEFDFDDGRAVYELDFRFGQYEFEYEIDALSGKILDFEKEIDD